MKNYLQVKEKNLQSGLLKKISLLPFFLCLFAFSAFSQTYYVGANADNIVRETSNGLATNATFITGGSDITDIYVDKASGFIYWINSTTATIGRADLPSGDNVNQVFITTDIAPNNMTIANGFIYYTHNNGNIGRADEAGTLASVNNSFITGANAPKGIVAVGSSLVWANSGNGTLQFKSATAGAASGGIIHTGETGISELDIIGSDIYWIDPVNNTIDIGSVSFGFSVTEGIVTGVTGTSLSIDEDNQLLFWNQSATTMGSANLDGMGADLAFLTGFDDIQGSLHADIDFGIAITDFTELNELVCPNSNVNEEFLTAFTILFDIDNDATYSVSFSNSNGLSSPTGASLVENSGGLNLVLSVNGDPGVHTVIVTITDPDGVESSAIPFGNIIAVTSTSVTFEAGSIETYGAASLQGQEFTSPDGTTHLIGGDHSNLFSYEGAPAVYTAPSGAFVQGVSGGNQIPVGSSGSWKVNGMAVSSVGQVFNSGTLTGNLQLSVSAFSSGSITLNYMGGAGSEFPLEYTMVDGCGVSEAVARDIFYEVILPVDLVSFEANKAGKDIALAWETASESNNEGFDVEYSNNGKDWEKLGFVAGFGTTSSPQNYAYLHKNPTAGDNYYRLKQMDYDGQFEYSDIKVVQFGDASTTIAQLYPNPVKGGQLTLELAAYESGEIQVQVYDLTGKLHFQQSSFAAKTYLDVSQLAAGIYLIETAVNGQLDRQKVVVK